MSKSRVTFPWAGLLTIVFITLKLAEIGQVAHWSWWWVLSPVWITLGLWVFLAVVLALLSWYVHDR
jgi:hypothetical protein